MPVLFFKNPNLPLNVVYAQKLTQCMTTTCYFNTTDPSHIELISQCQRQLNDQLRKLQTLDMKIIAGLTLGGAAIGLSILFPALGTVATAGIAWSAYCFGQREKLAQDYNESLNNLIGCCEWVLKDTSKVLGDVLSCQAVNKMIEVLAPLTSKQQLRDIIDDKVEEGYIEQSENVSQRTVLLDNILNRPLNQKERNVYFSIYGYQQGSIRDVLNGIYYLCSQGAGWVRQTANQYFRSALADRTASMGMHPQ